MVWTGVALNKWRHLRARNRERVTESRPAIACDLSALAPLERERYGALRSELKAASDSIESITTGVRLRIRSSMSLADLAEWMTLERRCCPFLTISLGVGRDATTTIEIDGGDEASEFLREEFGASE